MLMVEITEVSYGDLSRYKVETIINLGFPGNYNCKRGTSAPHRLNYPVPDP